MNVSCPSVDELLRLLDGEVAERRAATLRLHVESCPACGGELRRGQRLLTRIAAPLESTRLADVEGVMRRLGSRPPPRPAPPRWAVATAALSALSALAACLLALVLLPGRGQEGFQARGAVTAEEWTHQIGVHFYAVEPKPRRLERSTPVSRDTPLLGVYRNLDTTGAVYLLAFAVDARGTVHWLYPAYTEATQDPTSVLLPTRREDTPLSETVVLDAPSLGPARLVTVLSREPLHVSDIESLPPEQLSTEALRARLGAAQVSEWPLLFTP